jgi:hypothetical protein
LQARWVAIGAAFSWAISFVTVWIVLWSLLDEQVQLARVARLSILIAGCVSCIGIVGAPIYLLFRKRDLVAAAMEIESRRPKFDQRLITVASQPPDSQLLRQLADEVDLIIADENSTPPMSLRPLLAPILTALTGLLLLILLMRFSPLHFSQSVWRVCNPVQIHQSV